MRRCNLPVLDCNRKRTCHRSSFLVEFLRNYTVTILTLWYDVGSIFSPPWNLISWILLRMMYVNLGGCFYCRSAYASQQNTCQRFNFTLKIFFSWLDSSSSVGHTEAKKAGPKKKKFLSAQSMIVFSCLN